MEEELAANTEHMLRRVFGRAEVRVVLRVI